MTFKFDGWPRKPIGHLFYATLSFLHHFVAIGEFKLELQSGNAKFGSNSMVFSRVTLKFDWWPWKTIGHLFYAASSCVHNFIAICEFKLELRVRKRPSWVLTSVTLTFDFKPWPFAWTSLLSMVMTPEHFMMIRWWEHGEKGVTDRQTDKQTYGQTDWISHIAAWSQLKTHFTWYQNICRHIA